MESKKLKTLSTQERINALKIGYDRYTNVETFKPGDIVFWKANFKNNISHGPFIVVELLETPIFIDEQSVEGYPIFTERRDVRLMSLRHDTETEDNDLFVIYAYDSRFFTKTEPAFTEI